MRDLTCKPSESVITVNMMEFSQLTYPCVETIRSTVSLVKQKHEEMIPS